ncbi:MAG: ferrous iron transport protein A [Candidatus Hydrogenedens sp.]|nr:ferrous iron transport protein A [Candidatus Hydrogenedens sp.]
MTLADLQPGDFGTVERIMCLGPVQQRLLELGMSPGVDLEVIRTAPLGDPMEVYVRGFHLTLRRNEARCVILK